MYISRSSSVRLPRNSVALYDYSILLLLLSCLLRRRRSAPELPTRLTGADFEMVLETVCLLAQTEAADNKVLHMYTQELHSVLGKYLARTRMHHKALIQIISNPKKYRHIDSALDAGLKMQQRWINQIFAKVNRDDTNRYTRLTTPSSKPILNTTTLYERRPQRA